MSLSTGISIPLKGDNQGSIALAHNPVFRTRTKHTLLHPGRGSCKKDRAYVRSNRRDGSRRTDQASHPREIPLVLGANALDLESRVSFTIEQGASCGGWGGC